MPDGKFNPDIDEDLTENQTTVSAFAMIACIIASIVLIVIFWAGIASAEETLPKWRVVYAIIGEAEGEWSNNPAENGMLAVACAIQNRGTLKGVYGETSPRVKQRKYSSRTLVRAVQAYEESLVSANCEYIGKATHWEGTAFRAPYWAKDMVVTATIGNQRFYRARAK